MYTEDLQFVLVKVWCIKQEANVIKIDMKANICCVWI
ncbi:hypothetical protein ES319_A03G061600v1 [Gossypium barbadense]|uniref:Uncharacterized protein n=2 Tax=Gossypium TaxID=3633 RepID=A0A5J5WDE8_GOSBA|nr:hypothetical protein ES319_A03G061600v1 [Gossypium barbadense]TYH24145.1 hypothetical protein ES288_A03G068100v1 [Gossypium darwinii]TYH24148.1 hypothetical protein ES288_A03G068100v1 [Gossypium darwinii]